MENVIDLHPTQDKLEMLKANVTVIEKDLLFQWYDFAKNHIRHVRESLDILEAEIDKHL